MLATVRVVVAVAVLVDGFDVEVNAEGLVEMRLGGAQSQPKQFILKRSSKVWQSNPLALL